VLQKWLNWKQQLRLKKRKRSVASNVVQQSKRRWMQPLGSKKKKCSDSRHAANSDD